MTNDKLEGAARDLFMALDEVIDVYTRLEDLDDDGQLGLGADNRDLEKQFAKIFELLDGLANCVEIAAEQHMGGHRKKVQKR